MRFQRNELMILLGLFLIALALRLLAIHYFSVFPSTDSWEYHVLAKNIFSNLGFGYSADISTNYRFPLYPVFIAFIYGIFGTDYQAVYYVQAVVSSALVYPIFYLARKISGLSWAGILASMIFTVHPSFLFVPRLLAENFLMVLSLGFVIFSCLLFAKHDRKILYALAAGVCAGLMGLTKPEFSLIGIGLLITGIFCHHTRQDWKYLVLLALVSISLVGSWQARNAFVADSSDGRSSLALGTFIFSNCPALQGTWWWTVSDASVRQKERAICMDVLMDYINPSADISLQRSKFDEVKEKLFSNPRGFAQLIVNRALMLWISPPRGNDILIKYIGSWAGWLGWVAKCLFAFFGFVGLFLMLRSRPESLPLLTLGLYATVVYSLIHAVNRYGIFFVPELSIAFAYTVLLTKDRLDSMLKGGQSEEK